MVALILWFNPDDIYVHSSRCAVVKVAEEFLLDLPALCSFPRERLQKTMFLGTIPTPFLCKTCNRTADTFQQPLSKVFSELFCGYVFVRISVCAYVCVNACALVCVCVCVCVCLCAMCVHIEVSLLGEQCFVRERNYFCFTWEEWNTASGEPGHQHQPSFVLRSFAFIWAV